MKNKLQKNFIYNTIGSVLYSMTSLFFMIIVVRINGIDDGGLFTFAFSTACLLWVIGVYYGRVYQITERDKNITESDFIYNKIITCSIMIFTGILFITIKKYEQYKFIVMLSLIIYKSINAFSEALYAFMQKEEELYKVGISLFIKALIETIAFIIVNIITKNLIYSTISLIIVETAIIITYDYNVIKKYNIKIKKFNRQHNNKILKNGFPVFVITILTQYLINAPRYAIDNFLTNKEQSIYGILSMIATLTAMLSQLIMQPYINSMNEDLKMKNNKEFDKKVKKICAIITLIGLVEVLFGYQFGAWIIGLIYGINLKKYTEIIIIIIIGSILYSIVSIISNALITLRENNIQFIIFLINSIIVYFLSNFMVRKYEIFGAAYSYLIGMLILLCLIVIAYNLKKKKTVGE